MLTRSSLVVAVAVGSIAWATIAAQDLDTILYTEAGQLCTVSATGGEALCLKTGREYDSPAWQPGGGRTASEAGQHDRSHSLVLLDSRGRQIRALVDSSNYLRPTWSPDGRFIFAINYTLGSAIGRWTADGLRKTRVEVMGGAEAGRTFQMVSFSPSGTRAALLTMDFREMVVATRDQDGFHVFGRTPEGFRYVSQSAWRDEGHLLFVGKREGTQGGLWEVTISTGQVLKRGVEGLWLRDQLAISPDRESIIVTAVADSKAIDWSVWQYSLRTQKKRRLTTGIVASWR